MSLNEEEMERDSEIAATKMRYEIKRQKDKKLMEEVDMERIDNNDNSAKRAKIDDTANENEEGVVDKEKERNEIIEDAQERQIFDPINKIFDYSKRRFTDLGENNKVYLPKLCDAKEESQIEMMCNVVMDEFKRYKNEVIYKKLKNIKDADEVKMENIKRRNQEHENLTAAEKRGISKLRKRIEKDEIVIIKTDKSGKLGVISKERYLKTGIKGNGADKEVNRDELKKIEKNLNDHTRMICKVVNAGEYNGHIDRILSSKIVNSESTAPKYYLFKDHKKSESWRPVVSGCSSNTLGLSNMLSDIVESICGSIKDPL